MICIPHSIVWVIKSMSEMGGACSTYGARRGAYRILVSKPEEGGHLGDACVDGRIILRRVIRKWDVGVWTGLIWLRIGTGCGHL